jgi:hypothetical protein
MGTSPATTASISVVNFGRLKFNPAPIPSMKSTLPIAFGDAEFHDSPLVLQLRSLRL